MISEGFNKFQVSLTSWSQIELYLNYLLLRNGKIKYHYHFGLLSEQTFKSLSHLEGHNHCGDTYLGVVQAMNSLEEIMECLLGRELNDQQLGSSLVCHRGFLLKGAFQTISKNEGWVVSLVSFDFQIFTKVILSGEELTNQLSSIGELSIG